MELTDQLLMSAFYPSREAEYLYREEVGKFQPA
jgi:hypothetical protein